MKISATRWIVIISIGIVLAVFIIGLYIILTTSFESSVDYNSVYQQTLIAVRATNNAVSTLAADTATAKSAKTGISGATSVSLATPNLNGTARAQALDVQATQLAQTATAPPADLTPETPAASMTLIATQSLIINNDAGRIIGDGEVRVYAPVTMSLNDAGEIQVQIEANPQSNGNATLNPQPTQTPMLSTPRATPTPLTLVDNGRQFITVYEYMSATLRGAQLTNFNVDAIPPSGVRHITGSGTVYWWKWSISPKKEAIGTDNALEVYIVPQSNSTGSPIDSEARTISFTIRVNDASSQSNTLLIVGGLLLAITLVVGGLMLQRTRSSRAMMPPAMQNWGENRVFISYRRDDSLEVVGRIYDRLAEHFGRPAIFKDMESIQVGVDFRSAITESVGRTDVMLAVIGDRWLTITDSDGKRRLDDPQDFVRLEIETALERNIMVIPLLVRNAHVPAAADLPNSLSQLSYRNGLPIRPDPDFNNDMDRLIKELDTVLTNPSAKKL